MLLEDLLSDLLPTEPQPRCQLGVNRRAMSETIQYRLRFGIRESCCIHIRIIRSFYYESILDGLRQTCRLLIFRQLSNTVVGTS